MMVKSMVLAWLDECDVMGKKLFTVSKNSNALKTYRQYKFLSSI